MYWGTGPEGTLHSISANSLLPLESSEPEGIGSEEGRFQVGGDRRLEKTISLCSRRSLE